MAKKELITTGLIALVLMALIALTWNTILSVMLAMILLLTVPMRLIQHFFIDRDGNDYLDDDNG